MKVLKLPVSAWILALSVLFIAGCINYEQTTDLKSNGSGTMVMHYSLSQQLVAMMSMGGNQGGGDEKTKDMPFKLKEDEVRADLKAAGVKVEKFETKTEGENQHFYVHIAFDKITALNQTKTFKEMPFEWTEKDGTIRVKQTLKGKNEGKPAGEKKPEDEMAKNMAKAMFGNAAFTFKMTLPSKALPAPDTNGTIAGDGRTVSWTFPLVDLGDSSKDMTAAFKAGGFPLKMIALIGGAAILSLIALVVVIMFARKA
ncbi:MAG TPA: hypothetical protein VLR94_10725 [Acidobacteriota bacterium]|nr:hypothetical protein [Acidobacteriota bacterium]